MKLNKINALKSGVFDGLLSLESLELHNNNIQMIDSDVFPSSFFSCKQIGINMGGNPIGWFPDEKLPKFRNPYQCAFTFLSDIDPIIDKFFQYTLLRLDLFSPTFEQVENVVPKFEQALSRDYLQMPITAHYGFNLIPSLDGTVEGLHVVRQLAVEVCALIPSFCTVREQIHQFPTLEHLFATTKLKEELISANASSLTIKKVTELESALSQMFSMTLDYRILRMKLPEGALKAHLDQLFAQTSWNYSDLAGASMKIQEELTANHDADWTSGYFIPLFKVKSFLIFTFKKKFWAEPVESLLNAKTLHSLVTISQSMALLSSREANFLIKKIDQGEDLKTIVQKSSQWQLKNLEREHFSQPNNPAYTPVSPDYQDPKVVLQPLFEKIVRTSLIAEWDRLL